MKFPLKKRKLLIGILIVALTLFVLNLFQKEVRAFFYSFSAPIQKVLWRAGDRTSDFFESIIKTGNLRNEVDEFKLKNQELLAQVVFSEELKKENKVLREALEIELQKDFNLILSQIISKDISQDFILIDKGSKDGISEDMPAITQQRVLVGKISEVYENFSKIMLISNKESSFNAKIDNISGMVRGQGNSKILFDLIPKEAEIFKGDIIATSALGKVFPKGLLVGEIKKIKKIDVEPFQQAEIEPFFKVSQADILFIILDF